MSDRFMWQSLMELCCRKGRTAVALQVCRSTFRVLRPLHQHTAGPMPMPGQGIALVVRRRDMHGDPLALGHVFATACEPMKKAIHLSCSFAGI